MFKLNNTSSAWFNYYSYIFGKFNNLGIMITPEQLTKWLEEYNGIVIDHADSQGWQPYFKTEQDMTYFVLKWA